MPQVKPKPLPNPLDAAVDVRRGATRMQDLPPETQQQVRRLNRFNEGKIVGHAAKQRPQGRTFLPGARTRRAVLS